MQHIIVSGTKQNTNKLKTVQKIQYMKVTLSFKRLSRIPIFNI
jgi:hypothetical protein